MIGRLSWAKVTKKVKVCVGALCVVFVMGMTWVYSQEIRYFYFAYNPWPKRIPVAFGDLLLQCRDNKTIKYEDLVKLGIVDTVGELPSAPLIWKGYNYSFSDGTRVESIRVYQNTGDITIEFDLYGTLFSKNVRLIQETFDHISREVRIYDRDYLFSHVVTSTEDRYTKEYDVKLVYWLSCGETDPTPLKLSLVFHQDKM
jgi:hypothetical protein